MSHSPTEDDQRTIKRCYHNLKKDHLNTKNLTSLPSNIYPIKKPLDQLFYQHFVNYQDSSIPSQNNRIHQDFLTPSEPQQSLQLVNLTKKFEQNKNHNVQDLQKCCTRLFTFMQSTQKEKIIDENKENQSNQNITNAKENHLKLSLKASNNDLPLKIHPKTQRSTKLLKKIDHRIKKQEKTETLPKEDKQKDLLNFIEGSRKKRQELLIQLERFDFDHVEELYASKMGFLTPQEGASKKSLPKVKVESSRNSLQGGKSKKNFFRKHSLINPQKSPRIVMKENLRQRHFSELPLRQSIATVSPKSIIPSFNNTTKNSIDPSKRQSLLKKVEKSSSKKLMFSIKGQQIKEVKNQCKKSTQKLRINDSQDKSLRKSLSRKEKVHIKQSDENEREKTMEQLMKRKKQLEKQLLSLNDDITLFNRKKKKPSKGFK